MAAVVLTYWHNSSMHQYGWVCSTIRSQHSPTMSIVFWAASLASSSSMSNEVKSSLMFLSQVEHGRPGGLSELQEGLKQYSVCIHLPIHTSYMSKQWKTSSLDDGKKWGCSVMRWISSFMTKSCHWMLRICRRHHWSSASIRSTSALLTVQHSNP